MTVRSPHTETMSLAGGQPVVAEYTQALREGVAWLRFQPALEAEFRRSHLIRVRPQARFWQFFQVVIGVVAINAVLGGTPSANDMRLLIACLFAHMLVSTVLLALAFSNAYLGSYLRVAPVLTPLRATAFACIVADLVDTGGSGTAAMTINMFGLMFFSGLLLRQALPAAGAMVAAFVAALAAFDVPWPVAAYSVSSLLVVFGLSAFVAWDTQRASRVAFLEHGVTRADASRDALTGLANRRNFDARLDTMWRAAEARQSQLAVLLIDIDHFKAYNDHYGHQAGDEALRAVARAIEVEAGKAAVVARFGGEEMSLLATGMTEHEAEALAARIRRAVEALEIPHQGAPDAGKVTVSIGGACIVPLAGRSASGVLQLADQNLYAAKRQGRNCVVFHGEEYAHVRTGSFRHGPAGS